MNMWKPLSEKSYLRNAMVVEDIRKSITEWDLEYLPYDEDKMENVIIFRRKRLIEDDENEKRKRIHDSIYSPTPFKQFIHRIIRKFYFFLSF